MSTPNNFAFPQATQQHVEALLAKVKEGGPVRSVRPERNAAPVPLSTAPLVPVAIAPVTPKSDPEGISVDLPSRFHYYTFKDLYVKPLRNLHLSKLAKVHATGSMQILAEVVSSVLSTSGTETDLGFKLTIADFNYVLYWLRLNSFSKPQMRVTSTCTNPEHIHKVESGELDKSTLKITTIYKESDMVITYLDAVPAPAQYSISIGGVAFNLRPELIIDAITFLDSANWQDEEFQFAAKIAAVVDAPLNLLERIKLLEDMSPDDTIKALEFADLLDNYGVTESIDTNCMGCGASGSLKLTVDASCFLSPEF